MTLSTRLFFLSLCVFPFLLTAQVDAKYLKGSVPEVDGKVVFTTQIAAENVSKETLFGLVKQWAEANYKGDDNRIVLDDPIKGILVCQGRKTLVFKAQTLSLDTSDMLYQLFLQVESSHCNVTIKQLKYRYPEGGSGKILSYPAEEMITDQVALNKQKLYRQYGKFRIHTINTVEDLYGSLDRFLNGSQGAVSKNVHQLAQGMREAGFGAQVVDRKSINATPTTETTEFSGGLAGYRKIEAGKIPGNIIQMLTEDWMLITAGDETQFNMMTASWGGLGSLWNRPISIAFIGASRFTKTLMDKGDYYTLSFYTEAYREVLNYCGKTSGKEINKVKESGLTPITLPSGAKAFSEAWLILECKKTLSQQITKESIQDLDVSKRYEDKLLHTMYVGEILNVWVK